MSNEIHVIAPYRHASTWVFDDPAVGLQAEPFVSGIPEMIDVLVAAINPRGPKERGSQTTKRKEGLNDR